MYLLLLGLMLRETDSFWKECCGCPAEAGSAWHGSAWPGTWLAAGCLLPGALSLRCCCCCGEWQLEKILGWNQWCWGNSAVIDAFNCAAGETEWYSLAGNVWTVFTHLRQEGDKLKALDLSNKSVAGWNLIVVKCFLRPGKNGRCPCFFSCDNSHSCDCLFDNSCDLSVSWHSSQWFGNYEE